jgi:hypothetical protein
VSRSGDASKLLALVGVVGWSIAPAMSRAEMTDEAGARVLFAEGRKLADDGRYGEACPKFEASFRLDPGIGTNFNLADCFEHLGRTASAWGRFLDVAAATKAAGQPQREQVARARAAALEPNLVRLVIEVSSPVGGLIVERDGVPVGRASWGLALPVDPGDHIVAASAPGKKRWSQSMTIPNLSTTVAVAVPALDDLPPEKSSDATAIFAPPPPAARPRVIPVVTLSAVAAAALIVSTVFALQVESNNGEAKALCVQQNQCLTVSDKARHDQLISDAYRDQDIAFVSVGVAGAAILAAAYLWWRPVRSPPDSAAAPRLSAGMLATSSGIGLEVKW